MVAIAIYCGPDGKQLPVKYEYSFLNTRLQYEYNTICLLDYSDEELAASTNPFAWIMLAAKDALLRGKDLDKRLLQGKLTVFRKLYNYGALGKEKLKEILLFLDNYVEFKEKETYLEYDNEIHNLTNKNNTMDTLELAIKLRRERMARFVVEELLKQTRLSPEKISSVTNIPLRTVKAMQRKLNKKKI